MGWIFAAIIIGAAVFFVAWQRHGWEVASGAAAGIFAAVYAAGEAVVGWLIRLFAG